MITRLLNKNSGPLFRATLIGSGILCFLLPTAGFSELAARHLSREQSLLGLGIVVGLTLQAMILFAVVALLEKLLVKRTALHEFH